MKKNFKALLKLLHKLDGLTDAGILGLLFVWYLQEVYHVNALFIFIGTMAVLVALLLSLVNTKKARKGD